MAIPSGSGTECFRNGTVDTLSNSSTALNFAGAATSQPAIDITAKYGMNIVQDISAGYAASIGRNIAEAGSYPLVDIVDEHASVTQSALRVRTDGVGAGSLALEVVGRMRLGGRAAAIQSPIIAMIMS